MSVHFLHLYEASSPGPWEDCRYYSQLYLCGVDRIKGAISVYLLTLVVDFLVVNAHQGHSPLGYIALGLFI